MMDQFEAAYLREKKIRKQAEQLLEDKSRELFLSMQELKASQSQLVQSEKMASLGILSAGIAHEINNPLGYIASNFNALKDSMGSVQSFLNQVSQQVSAEHCSPAFLQTWQEAKSATDLDFIMQDFSDLVSETQEGISRVQQIISDLRDFSRKDSAKKFPVDVNKSIQVALNILKSQIQQHTHIEFIPGNIPKIQGYSGKLHQVFTNLIDNALDECNQGGNIKISTYADNDFIYAAIADDGKGIAQDNLKQLFTPFFTTKEVGKGTGLGLSISLGFIEEHKGTIQVNSNPGNGSCFTVKIPISEISGGPK